LSKQIFNTFRALCSPNFTPSPENTAFGPCTMQLQWGHFASTDFTKVLCSYLRFGLPTDLFTRASGAILRCKLGAHRDNAHVRWRERLDRGY